MSSVGTVPSPVLTNTKQDRRGERQRVTEMERLPFVGCRDIGRRFPIQVRILFRPKSEHEWRAGWTENMSRSGVLFHTHALVTVGTDIEIRLVLEFEASLAPPPELVCEGRIVRVAEPEQGFDHATVGVQFSDYRFHQSRSAMEMFARHESRPGRVN